MSEDQAGPFISPISKKWIRTFLGLGSSVPFALLPIFGEMGIPPFDGLLSLIPESIQKPIILLGCAAMSLTAISVEFRVIAKAGKEKLLREARRGLLISAGLLLTFCLAYSQLVTTVHLLYGSQSVSFVTGLGKTEKFPCVNESVDKCIGDLTFNESEITSYFGDEQIRLSKLLLGTMYVGFFASFGNVVGILVALQAKRQVRPRKKRPASRVSSDTKSS